MIPITIFVKRPGERISDLYLLHCDHLQDGSWRAAYRLSTDREKTLPLGTKEDIVRGRTMNEVQKKMNVALTVCGYREAA